MQCCVGGQHWGGSIEHVDMVGRHMPLLLDELELDDEDEEDEELVGPLDDEVLLAGGPPPMPALKSPTAAMHATPESAHARGNERTSARRLIGSWPPTR
jgi:hypothetical protein